MPGRAANALYCLPVLFTSYLFVCLCVCLFVFGLFVSLFVHLYQFPIPHPPGFLRRLKHLRTRHPPGFEGHKSSVGVADKLDVWVVGVGNKLDRQRGGRKDPKHDEAENLKHFQIFSRGGLNLLCLNFKFSSHLVND